MSRLLFFFSVLCLSLISMALLTVYGGHLPLLPFKPHGGSSSQGQAGESRVEILTVVVETSSLKAEIVLEVLTVAGLDRRRLGAGLSTRLRDSLAMMEFESAKVGVNELRQIAALEAERVLPPGTLRALYVRDFLSRNTGKP